MNVWVVGYSLNNNEVWGIYTTPEAADEARAAIDRHHGEMSREIAWKWEVPLRVDGSIPTEPFIE